MLALILLIFHFLEENQSSIEFWESSWTIRFNDFVAQHASAVIVFQGAFFSQFIYCYIIFLLSYSLFPRDNAFYLTFVFSFTTMVALMLEIIYERPPYIMMLPEEEGIQERLKN